MIMDERSEFADNAAIGGGTGRQLLGDVIDSSVARDLGQGMPIYVVFQVTTAFDSAAEGASLQLEVVSDAQGAIATDGAATEHVLTEIIPEATLVAGYQRVIALPPELSVAYEQFLGVLANVTGEAFTSGNYNLFLTMDPQMWKSYADGTN